MSVEDLVKNALNTLTNTGNFGVDRVYYDEKNFGNIIAVLTSSNKQVDIRFIKDRGEFWCEVGQAGQWYFIEDVCTFIGISVVNKSNDFIDYIAEIANIIKANMNQILQAFDTKNLKDTQIKIKALATKRAMGMFK